MINITPMCFGTGLPSSGSHKNTNYHKCTCDISCSCDSLKMAVRCRNTEGRYLSWIVFYDLYFIAFY